MQNRNKKIAASETPKAAIFLLFLNIEICMKNVI